MVIRNAEGELMLTEDDKEWVKLVAEKLFQDLMPRIIAAHVLSCPHGKTLLISRWFLVGMMAGSGLAGGSIGALVVKVLMAVGG
jgi:hypothetical protein